MKLWLQFRISAATVFVGAAVLSSCSGPAPGEATFRNPKAPMERRVNDLIGRMQTEEKLALIAHHGNQRLGIPALETVEGEMGISAKVTATAFPANIGMAASWDPALAEEEGAVIAQQARSLGRGEVLGPLTEISHSPLSGRVFETYGEDPWLTSRMVMGYINGVQGEGEIATALFGAGIATQRSGRESDLRPLEAAVTEAGVWAVMPRYGSAGDILSFLRQALGFRGFAAVPEAASDEIDDQVRGILRAMFASGVFDREAKTPGELETPEHRAVARTAAAESIVLLKNEDNLLPLDRQKIRTLAVFGPNAAVNRMAGGSYTVTARYSAPPLEALREVFGGAGIIVPNAPVEASKADAAIVFVGTGATSEGESIDRISHDLPAGQSELIDAVARANPHTIVVVIAGYPVTMNKWIRQVPVVLDAWFPGEEGGHAIADVLTGAVNPAGRLPMTFPEFPFGFGLSYTQFEFSDLVILPQEVPPGQFVEVSVTIRNAGSRGGKETVQLYLRGKAAPKLRAFQQVQLQPGESRRVNFTLTGDATKYFDEKRQEWAQDQAVFEVRVGASSADIRATGKFETTE